MPVEYCSALYAGRLLGCCTAGARRKLGAHDAVTFYNTREVGLWRIGRVMALRDGVELPHPDEPTRWYCHRQAIARVEQLVGITINAGENKSYPGQS